MELKNAKEIIKDPPIHLIGGNQYKEFWNAQGFIAGHKAGFKDRQKLIETGKKMWAYIYGGFGDIKEIEKEWDESLTPSKED